MVEVLDTDVAIAHEDLDLRARDATGGKPYLTVKSGDSLEQRTGKWRDRVQRVDQANHWYDKVVTDKETGEVLRDCHEPLSDHVDRGSARKPPTDGAA